MIALVFGAVLWISACGFGFAKLWQYSNTPGTVGNVPERWPSASSIARSERQPTLVLVLHPHCPCSRATLRELARVVRPGAVLGSVSGAWTAGPAAVAATGVSVTAWPGAPVTVTVTPRPLGHAISQGQPVAQATVTIGGEVRHFTLVASRAVPAPSVRWRLTRL